MSVIRDYHIQASGKGRISVAQWKALVESAGLKMVSCSSGLVCGTCHGRGEIVNPAHHGCIVMPSDMLPCPDGCDHGHPTDEARHAAIRSGEV